MNDALLKITFFPIKIKCIQKKKKKFILSSAEFILFLTFILKLLVDLNLTRDFGDFVVQIKIWTPSL